MTRRTNGFARGLTVLGAAALGAAALAAASPALGDDGLFYLRADVGYGVARDAMLEDTNGANPLYGPNNWVSGDLGRSVVLGAGVGVRFLPPLRAEAGVHWLPGLEYTGVTRRSGAAVRADADALALMASVYVDLDRLDGGSGSGNGPIHPWVSAGLGAARTHLGSVRTEAAGRTITSPGGTSWRFAWSLGFGAAVDLTDSLALDLGYRYLDMGTVRTDGGTARMVSAGGTFTGAVDPVEARLRTHLVTVGLRYSF